MSAATPLAIEPLRAESFAPFGELIAAEAAAQHFAINGGNTERYHDLVPLQFDGGRPIVSLFRGQPRALPFAVTLLERHPLGSQAFVPLSGRPWLVVVAPPGANGAPPSPDTLRCFLARADQGVNYRAGTWHHPLLALETVCDFLVIDRAGPGANCEETHFAQPALITAAALAALAPL